MPHELAKSTNSTQGLTQLGKAQDGDTVNSTASRRNKSLKQVTQLLKNVTNMMAGLNLLKL